MSAREIALTDGGLETTLLFVDGHELPCFAAFPLLEDEAGRASLRRYFEAFLAIADEHGLPFVIDTPTWRANPDWGKELGYDLEALAAANARAVEMARELGGGRPGLVVNGSLGPRGDGYVVGEQMSADEAERYHAWQIGVLADAGADRITALTLSYADEAIGIVRAATARGIDVIVSFTVETDGRLPDGTALAEAVAAVDAATDRAALTLGINCAHPSHIVHGLDGSPALERIGALRVNASKLSHAELDEATELDAGDPDRLAAEVAALHQALPGLRLLGGCCGTDHRHVRRIADAWPDLATG